MTKTPEGWKNVSLGDVLHPKMLDELERELRAHALTEPKLRAMIDNPEYAKFMEEHGLLPRFAYYWLSAHLGVVKVKW